LRRSLRASPVLRHLAEDPLHALVNNGQLQHFAAGEELIRAEELASAVFLLVDGVCDVLRADGTVSLKAPALVGDIAVLTGTPKRATVSAVDGVQAIEEDRVARLTEMTQTASQVARAIIDGA